MRSLCILPLFILPLLDFATGYLNSSLGDELQSKTNPGDVWRIVFGSLV